MGFLLIRGISIILIGDYMSPGSGLAMVWAAAIWAFIGGFS